MTPFTHAMKAYADALYNHPTTQLLMKAWDEDRIVEVEGVQFRMTGDWTALEPGDTYVAGRNGPPNIYTVREVKERIGENAEYPGCVYATDKFAYPYDLHECYKVELI